MKLISPALPLVATLGFAGSGCSLVPVEFTATGKIQAEVRSSGCGNSYINTITYDPTTNADYNEYKDEIAQGSINWIRLEMTRLLPDTVNPPSNCEETGNRATLIAGQVDVRRTGQPDNAFIEGVSAWEGVFVGVGQRVTIYPVEYDNFDELNDLVFGGEPSVLDFRIQGVADEGPVRFDLEMTLEFTASN